MFIRPCHQKKDGRRHVYWTLVESYRTDRGPRQRTVAYKEASEKHPKNHLGELFALKYDLLLYGVTSTYFEGEAKANPKAQRGYSRDKRPEGSGHASMFRRADREGVSDDSSQLGDEPRRVPDELNKISMVDVVLPTRIGVAIRRRCVTQPTEHQAILLHQLGLRLPRQKRA